MNYNITGYMIYLPVTFYITIVVGRVCYRNGELYLSRIINEHPVTVRWINSMLLTGYYLVNLGYAAVMVSFWHRISSLQDLVETLSGHIGIIVLLLGILHVNNMLVTYLISKHINKHQSLIKKQL